MRPGHSVSYFRAAILFGVPNLPIGEEKRSKYIVRLAALMRSSETKSKRLEQVTGNLGYAAWVEPFCRPLLSCLYAAVAREEPSSQVSITPYMRKALRIWYLVLQQSWAIAYLYTQQTPGSVDAYFCGCIHVLGRRRRAWAGVFYISTW